MSIPSKNILPLVGVSRRFNVLRKVDFPPPLYPTNAVIFSCSILNDKFWYTKALGLNG